MSDHREWWLDRSDIRDAWRAELHNPCTLIPKNTIRVREVLPGDPTPEAIEEVAKQLDSDDRSYLHELAAKLRGETNE